MKKYIKILFSAAVFLWVIRNIDSTLFFDTVKRIPISSLVFLIFLYALGQVVSAYKWWLIVKEASPSSSFWLALKAYYFGMFVNIAGIGTFGGDMARAVTITPIGSKTVANLTSVVADRIHGLLVITAIGVTAIAFYGNKFFTNNNLIVTIIVLLGLIISWFFIFPISKFCFKSFPRIYSRLLDIEKVVPRSPQKLIIITFVSLVFHSIQIFMHSVMANALGKSLSFQQLLTTVPFVNIASALPISWQGLGVREGSYKFFLTPDVITREEAIAFGAMWLLSVTVVSLVGGGIATFMFPRKKDI